MITPFGQLRPLQGGNLARVANLKEVETGMQKVAHKQMEYPEPSPSPSLVMRAKGDMQDLQDISQGHSSLLAAC